MGNVIRSQHDLLSVQVLGVEDAKQVAVWGTFGIDRTEKLKYKRLIDCDTNHLQNILRTQQQVRYTDYDRIIRSILVDRGEKPENFSWEAAREYTDRVMKTPGAILD